jgi:hypothetical protein
MKIYSVYLPKNTKTDLESSIFVEDKFSFRAAIFNVFWFLYHKMWFAFFVCFFVSVSINMLVEMGNISEFSYNLANIFFMAVIGSFANNWYISYLKAKKYVLHDIILEKNLEKARFKYFERHVSMGL